MAKDVGIRLTGDAAGMVKACDDGSKALQGVGRIARTLTNDGADTATALKAIGERGGQAFQELIAAGQAEGKTLQQIKQDVLELAAAQGKQLRDAKAATVAEAQAQAVLEQRTAERAAAVAQAMGNMNAKAKEFVGELMSAGSELGALQRQMQLAFGDPKAAKAAVDAIRDLDDNTGIAEQSLAQAAVSLQKFGAFSEENLTRAAIAAKKTNQPIEAVAEAIGKFQKFGDARSTLTLKKMLGLDDKDIASAGGALEALDAKFGTTTEGMTSATVKLKGELDDLKQEIGINLVKSMGSASEAMLPFAQALHQMPDAMKAAIGQGAVLYNGITSIGSTALSVAAQMKMAGLSMSGIWTAVTSAMGPVGITLAAVAVAVEALTLSLQVEAEAIEKAAEKTEKFNKFLRDHKQLLIDIANGKKVDWKDAKAADDAEFDAKKNHVARLKALQDEAAFHLFRNPFGGRDKGTIDADIANEEAAIRKINKMREDASHAMDKADKPAPETDKADKAAAENGAAAWDNYRKRVTNGFYETKEAQLKGLEEVTKKLQHHGQAWTQAELEKAGVAKDVAKKILGSYEDTHLQQIRLTREVGKEKEADSKKAAQETLRDGLHAIEMEEAHGKLSHAAKIQRLNALLAKLGGDKEIRINLEKQIANETRAAHDEVEKKRAEGEKKREEAARKAEEAHQKRLQAEEDIASKIKGLAGETTSDKMREIDRQVDAYRKAGVDEVQIAKFAKMAKADIEKKDSEKKLDEHQKTVTAQDQLAKDVEDDLKQQLSQGKDVSAQLTASINTRYQHEMDALRQKAALHQDDAEMQAQTQAQIQHLENQRRREVNDVTKAREDENRKLDETKKKLEDLQKQKNFKGGAQSVAEAFGDGSTFGFSLDTGLLGGGGGKSGPGAAGASGSTGAGTTAAGASAGPMPATASAGGAGTPPLVPGATAAAAATGASGDKSSWKSQKESSRIGGDPAAALNKIIELLSLIADRLQGGGGKPSGGGSPAAAGAGDAASGLGMALSRDAFFSKGK